MRLLITGGTGTLGRCLIRGALASRKWSAVISYSRDELKASQLVQEFGDAAPFKAFLGDVRDPVRLSMALRGVHVVIHAAALKRVDIGAYSPSELIATNVYGTMNVINASIEAGVRRIVMVSSDKAVAPSNLYGASKMCAEIYSVQANAYGYPQGTRIACVRYGNILGSRGSVIETWRDQIRRNQPLTVTDHRMSRFVMTIEQARDLINYAIDGMQGGEVFVPILPSANITDLSVATLLIEGVTLDYKRVECGLRPGGEKIAESLLNSDESARTRRRDSYLVVAPTHHEWVSRDFGWLGDPLDANYQYQSNGPQQRFLNSDELCELMRSTETCAARSCGW